ncbi:SusD/RagB family nutrient-binding outer membrane lipoprotein [uncultured Dokdonia sp.]|uniref:SusD/RagB family nutrient-binding outer membrane lipoprotein n=1 Tax=uncultured Dokdonia sp. TaxID=575653 RepID=UPI0030EDABB1
MKKHTIKYNIFFMLLALVGFTSCETIELDLTEDPLSVGPDSADPQLLLNQIQIDFAFFAEASSDLGSQVTRIDHLFGRQYLSVYGPTSFDALWSRAYRDILADIRIMNPLAEEAGLSKNVGIGQFIEAYTIVTLVDLFGDVPYSEAIDATNINPAADDDAELYDRAIVLLDNAIANFSTAAPDPDTDFYYDNNFDNWIKAANTLKMKIYLSSRLVNTDAPAAFNAIVTSGNFISDNSEDLQFSFGSNEVSPDTRHPDYSAQYTGQGGGAYQSNWLMNQMNSSNDTRIRYYFYRQNAMTPGADGEDPSLETLACSATLAPPHYDGFTFCYLSDGYWGRDSGDDGGIPPDGLLRTAYGVYPAGGQFDDDTFGNIAQGSGGGGAGIQPILLASSVDFYRAEFALLNGQLTDASNFVRSAITKSITKVQTFGDLDGSANLASFAPSASDNAAFVNDIVASFDANNEEGRFNILGEQFFVSLFGNGMDAYNFYRRTGFPSTLQPNIEANPGAFIRSMLYPQSYAATNSNAQQKPDQTVQVFWDTNPASGFPLSN